MSDKPKIFDGTQLGLWKPQRIADFHLPSSKQPSSEAPGTLIGDEAEMACGFYGYGRWDAPYWFIGPEPGGENNALRAEMWIRLGQRELCDCREFHISIGEMRWHFKRPKPDLQRTWRPLILLLMTFLREPSTEEPAQNGRLRELIREYQRTEWGMVAGQTCVIELSGLSAKKKKAGQAIHFLDERIQRIREMVQHHRPRFVVMYGVEESPFWERIAGCALVRDKVKRSGDTLFLFTSHPQDHGKKDIVWKELGKMLCEA